MTIDIPQLNPLVLSQFRRMTYAELAEVKAEAQRVIRLHKSNALGGLFAAWVYLDIPEVKSEMQTCESIITYADAVLAEWATVLANGQATDEEYAHWEQLAGR